MRYQEAYELIDLGIVQADINFPVSPSLKSIYFDQAVEDVGLRYVQKRDMETFTSSGKEYIFTKANVSDQIYKVELGSTDVPFVPESVVISDVADDDISKIGYFLKTGTSTGSITGVSTASTTVVTSSSHGLDTGDYVIFSEIVGHYVTATKESYLNNKRLPITKVDDNSFSVAINSSSGTTAYSSGGFWQEDSKKLHLTKTPDSGDTLKVFYYAKPEPKNNIRSRIDLPNQLINAVIHRTLAHLLDLSNQLQLGSGHRGLAEKIEQEYISTSKARELMPHMIPNPMQSFVTTRNGSIGNLTGADD